MHFFGDPNFPRRNLSGGAAILALMAFLFGTIIERIIWRGGSWVEYLFAILFVMSFLAALKTFRLGLDAIPPDRRIPV